MKTGYIRASGFNVATSALREDRRVVAVVMGGKTAQSRDQHMVSLIDRSIGRATQVARVSAAEPRPPNGWWSAPAPCARPHKPRRRKPRRRPLWQCSRYR
ncbi:hypothetical protein MBH78_09235 [Oceanimonas sp. NS1]|nr:hypothetical protein [Oceanimonas sp. NS1]